MGLYGMSEVHSMVACLLRFLHCIAKPCKTKHKNTAKPMWYTGHKQHVYRHHFSVVLTGCVCGQSDKQQRFSTRVFESASYSVCYSRNLKLTLAFVSICSWKACSTHHSQQSDAVSEWQQMRRDGVGRLSQRTQLGNHANTGYSGSSETSLQEDNDYVEFINLIGQMVLTHYL